MNKNKCVLVCDDDDGILDVVKIVLEEKNYQVVIVNNSNNIYHKITETKPDLILLDLWMSGIGGETITKRLKSNSKTKAIPIIILSANRQTVKITNKIGADGYLTKPFDILELEKIVSKYV